MIGSFAVGISPSLLRSDSGSSADPHHLPSSWDDGAQELVLVGIWDNDGSYQPSRSASNSLDSLTSSRSSASDYGEEKKDSDDHHSTRFDSKEEQ